MFKEFDHLRRSKDFPINKKGLVIAYTNEDGRKYGKRSKKLDSLYKTIALGRVIVVKWGNQATKVYEWRKNARESYI